MDDEIAVPVVTEPTQTEKFLDGRRSAYVRTFINPEGDKVLSDLAKFCRFGETTFHPGSDRVSALLEGRREVFLRILQHLNLSQEQLMLLFAGVHRGKE